MPQKDMVKASTWGSEEQLVAGADEAHGPETEDDGSSVAAFDLEDDFNSDEPGIAGEEETAEAMEYRAEVGSTNRRCRAAAA